MNVKTADRRGRPYMASIGPVGGGAGASAQDDGSEGCGSTHAFLRNTPVEINEAELPIRVLRYGLVGDTGGPGKYRGGLSMVMDFQLFAPNSVVTARNRDRSIFASPGICGGKAGGRSLFLKNPHSPNRVNLMNSDVVHCGPGDVISLTGSGGGGYGNPFERPVELVANDVRRRFVSRERAESEYGVVVLGDFSIDKHATMRLREKQSSSADGEHFGYCDNRTAYEKIWNLERYDMLTKFLAGIPVTWRFFVKHRIFAGMETQRVAGSGHDLQSILDAVIIDFTDLHNATGQSSVS